MPRSTIDRIEAGVTSPKIDTFDKVLAAVGYELIVQRRGGRRQLVLQTDRDGLRDRSGRHFPAHLPLMKPNYWGDGLNWWGWHRIAWWNTDPAVPEYSYWHPRRGHARRNARTDLPPPAHPWDDAT